MRYNKVVYYGSALLVGALLALIVNVGLSKVHPNPVRATNTYLSNLIVDDTKAVIGGVPVFQGTVSTNPTTPTLVVSSTGSAGASVSVTLAAASGKTTRIDGFDVSGGLVVAAVTGTVTVTGPANTLSYASVFTVTSGGVLLVRYPRPLPASGTNTAITVTVPAITGGPAVSVNAWGDQV